MPEPDAAMVPAGQPDAPKRHFRDDEVEELLTVMRQPDWKGSVSEAADVAGIDRRRAKLMLKHEIAGIVTRPDIKGNISWAAKELGLPMKKVWDIMQADGFLKTVNTTTDPAEHIPDVVDTFNREALTEAEMKEMQALVAQDKSLSSFQWNKLGLPVARQQDLFDLEAFAKGSLQSSLNLTHGGLIYCFAELIHLFKTTKHAYDSDTLPVELTEFGEKDSKKEYAYLLVSMTAEIRNLNSQVQRSQILKIKQAEIEIAKRMANIGPRKAGRKGQPGFTSGPPPVLVQVNTNGQTGVKVSHG